MGIRVVWDNEAKTVIRFDFDTTWTWSDFSAAIMEGRVLMKTVSHNVHSLLNLPTGMTMPGGNALSNLQRIIRTMPPNMGISVIANGSTLVNALANIVTRVYRAQQFITVNSLEAARALLEEYDRTHASPPQPGRQG